MYRETIRKKQMHEKVGTTNLKHQCSIPCLFKLLQINKEKKTQNCAHKQITLPSNHPKEKWNWQIVFTSSLAIYANCRAITEDHSYQFMLTWSKWRSFVKKTHKVLQHQVHLIKHKKPYKSWNDQFIRNFVPCSNVAATRFASPTEAVF